MVNYFYFSFFHAYLKTHWKFLVLVLILSACGKPNNNRSAGKLKIVSTTGMIEDLVQNIGGDSIEVHALMGAGVDPHLYKATHGDLLRLREADIIFYNGLHLEGKMGEVFEKLAKVKPVIPVAKNINKERLLADTIYQQTFDPHIWFDVNLWSMTIEVVLKELTRTKPQYKNYFENNASIYKSILEELHHWVKVEIKNIPEERRVLITAHDAFSYFGKAYKIEVRGLQGISTLSEFGLKDRVDMTNFIIKRGIKAVFVETSVSKRNIQSVVEGCRQKGHIIQIGGSLYSDALGEQGTSEGTYVGMVRSNVNMIVSALK